MHKNHLIGCGVGIVIALALVALSSGSAGSLGVLGAALLCPIVMIIVMRFLMEPGEHSHHNGSPTTEKTEPAPVPQPVPSKRS